MEGSLHTADLLMQKDRQEKLERNTKVLDSVINTIYTLGSQNMPLRGHRDNGKWAKARNRLNEHFKGICSNEIESKGAPNSKKRIQRPKGYQNHLDNRLKALNFVRCMEGSLHPADLLMQKGIQEKLERNTKVLDSVIDTIYTLGSQNMPLEDIEMIANIMMTREIILEIFK